MAKTRTVRRLPIAIIVSLLLLLLVQFSVLRDPNAVEEDFRTLIWVQRYQDPSLLSRMPFDKLNVRDVQVGPFYLIIENASPGYSLLAQVLSAIMSPSLFNKLLPFPLLVAGIYFIFRIGEKIADEKLAFALALSYAVLILASHTEISVIGGLHRSFVTPFLLALLFYLLEERFGAAAVILFLVGIVYLPIFPVSVMTFFFTLVNFRKNGRPAISVPYRPLAFFLLAIFLVAFAVSPIILDQFSRAQTEVGSVVVNEEEPPLHMLENPEFQPGGRRPLFSLFPFVGRGGFVTGNSDSLHIFFMFLLALVIFLIRGKNRQRLPAQFYYMFAASLIGFGLAWLGIIFTSSFLFYVPSRHTQSVFFLLLLIFIVINLEDTLQVVLGWLRIQRQKLPLAVLPLIIAAVVMAFFLPAAESSAMRSMTSRLVLVGLTAVLFLLALFYANRTGKEEMGPVNPTAPSLRPLGILLLLLSPLYIFFIQNLNNSFYFPAEAEEELFRFVETLPHDALLGGDPCSLDNLPFYARRSVLFSCERYRYLNDPEAVRAMLQAYYADSPDIIAQFCRDYAIDYLVVREETFTAEFLASEKLFYEPYNSWLLAQIGDRDQFTLNQIPDESKLYQGEGLFVMACDAETWEVVARAENR